MPVLPIKGYVFPTCPKTVWLATALGWLIAANTQAADSNLFDLPIEQLMQVQVTTSSKLAQSIAEAPGMVVVLTREQIQHRGYRNLRDLMKDLPGIEIKSHILSEHTTSVQMRGVPGRVANDQFVILLDGHRINEPSSAAISIDDNFPLYMVRQVEVAYGPYSTQYGADAMVGVINLISDDSSHGDKAQVWVEGGDYDYGRVAGYGQWQFDQFKLALGGHSSHSNNDSPAKLAPDRYQLGDLKRFSGDIVIPAADRADYRYPVDADSIYLKASFDDQAQLELMHSDFQAPTWGAEGPNTADYGSNTFWKQSLTTAWYDQHWHPMDDVEVISSLDYSRGEVDPDSAYRNRLSDFNLVYKYQRSERYQGSLEAHMGNELQAWVLGIQLQHLDVIPRTSDLPAPYDPNRPLNDQQMYYPGTNNSLPVRFYRVDYDNQAIYSELISQWTSRLSTQMGLRYEHNSGWDNSFTPRFAISYQLAPTLVLKGLYGQSYKAPAPELALGYYGSFSGQQDANGNYTSGFFRITNPDLQPERSRSSELGLHYQPSNNLLIRASLYRIQIDKVMRPTITSTPVRDFIPGGDIATTEQVQNLNRLTSQGLSTLIRYDWQISSNISWNTRVTYDYTKGTLSDPVYNTDIDLPTAHNQKLKFGGELKLGTTWSIVPSVYAMSSGNSNISNPNDPHYNDWYSPGYTTMDLLVNWYGLGPNTTVTLRAQNLFNRCYYEMGKGGSNYQNLAVQEGRWLQMGFSYQW